MEVKWVYKTKYNFNGKNNHFKATLVAKGYKQNLDIEYLFANWINGYAYLIIQLIIQTSFTNLQQNKQEPPTITCSFSKKMDHIQPHALSTLNIIA